MGGRRGSRSFSSTRSWGICLDQDRMKYHIIGWLIVNQEMLVRNNLDICLKLRSEIPIVLDRCPLDLKQHDSSVSNQFPTTLNFECNRKTPAVVPQKSNVPEFVQLIRMESCS